MGDMTVTTRQIKDMTIALSVGLDKSECASPVNTQELEEVGEDLREELEEIRAKGWMVDIPWDPFE